MKNIKIQNVFIDTSIYEEGQFVGSGTLKTLYDAAKYGLICILLPDITEREVLAHIDTKMSAEKDKLRRQLSTMMKHLEPLREKLEEVVKQSETAVQEMIYLFLEQLKIANVCRIPLQENLDISSIVDAYFRKEPPFSEKKKSEFPDAFVLKSLELWCKDNKQTCVILSNDNDMLNYKSEYLEPKNKDDYMKSLILRIQEERCKEKEEINRICHNAFLNLCDDVNIRRSISNWVREQLDNEVLYCTALQIEDINDYSINESNIEFFDDLDLVGTYDGCLVHRVAVEVCTDVVVNHPDYDTAYYDGEDKQWYFIDESKNSKLTSVLEFDIEFTTDENGDSLELDSINFGKNLTQRELERSLNDTVFVIRCKQ